MNKYQKKIHKLTLKLKNNSYRGSIFDNYKFSRLHIRCVYSNRHQYLLDRVMKKFKK